MTRWLVYYVILSYVYGARIVDVLFFSFGGQLFFDDEWRNQEVEELGT